MSATALAHDGCLALLGSEFRGDDLGQFADRFVGLAQALERRPATTG